MTDKFDFLTSCRRLGATVLVATAAAVGSAQAQNVVAFVNGEPITALDVEQRSKFTELATHQVPSKQKVLEELIDEKLKVREGRHWGLDPSDADIDSAFANAASRAPGHPNTEQFAQMLTKAGVTVSTYKARIRAELVWQQLVRGRYSASLEIGEQDVLSAMLNKKSDDDNALAYEYKLRQIIFLVAPGSPPTAFEERKRDAEGLRNRFRSCDEGLPFARGLGLIVRDEITRNSADVPADQRKALDSVPVGQLTAPEINPKLGIEMFAVCGKTEAKGDNAAGKRQARETVFAEKFEQLSKRYLQDLRRSALIEYR
jgi:peptidyl-prolyl cis-trans isomerase SurA